MRPRRQYHWRISNLLLLATAACLTACSGIAVNEVYIPHNLPHHQAFVEGAGGYSLKTGTGTVRGQMNLFNKDGSKFSKDGMPVLLMPVTGYTTEIAQREYGNGAFLSRPDLRLTKYVRTTTTDADGYFQFLRIPAGRYYVAGKITWETQETIYDGSNPTSEVTDQNTRKMYAEVEVKDGQTATLGQWIIGPERFK